MLYFLRAKMTQRIKIGYSVTTKKRVRGLTMANADDVDFLGEMQGERLDEEDLHRQFDQHRISGKKEWYDGAIHGQVMAILARDKAAPRLPRLNVIVAGDRNFRDDALVHQALDELNAKFPGRPIFCLLVANSARWISQAAWSWAHRHSAHSILFEPNWARHKHGAANQANKKMVQAQFDSKMLLVFHAEKPDSTTADLIKRATKEKLEIVSKVVAII